MKNFILKGDIVFSEEDKSLRACEDSYLVCADGKSCGVFSDFTKIPEEWRNFPLQDFSGKLIFPGLIDLHIHAPQFAYRGTAMDLELIDWLNTYTFPEEVKYADEDYARCAYGMFADAVKRGATSRAVIFATRHRAATEILMDLMEETGLVSYVGKINMDRESIPGLQEADCYDSAFNTFGWFQDIIGRYERTFPILTPRFIPSCSDELMNELHEIQLTYDVPVQSHLSENPGEIDWVKQLCPDSKFYGDAYEKWGLFGGRAKTVMAHCVYSCDEEVELMRKNGVFVAHCPTSNVNLASGIAPIRRYINEGLEVGLGSDVAGGDSEGMFLAIADAIKSSKMYWRLIDETAKPLTFAEAFYLATIGGGRFFGKVGSFLAGYEFDAVVLDDSCVKSPLKMSARERMERAVYMRLDSEHVLAKYVQGEKVKAP